MKEKYKCDPFKNKFDDRVDPKPETLSPSFQKGYDPTTGLINGTTVPKQNTYPQAIVIHKK